MTIVACVASFVAILLALAARKTIHGLHEEIDRLRGHLVAHLQASTTTSALPENPYRELPEAADESRQEIIAWARWVGNLVGGEPAAGLRCPKCLNIHVTTSEAAKAMRRICDCPRYAKLHFHFKCDACGFKALMRAADDEAS